MDSVKAEPATLCHVVAMPYPGRGHINPMMNLCKLLASKTNNIIVTFVVTEQWLGLIGSEPKPDNIRFGSVPNVIPSELVRAADHSSFFEATMTKLEAPFERLLDRLEPSATVILADTFLFWAVGVGHRRNISVASFWPLAASVFTVFQHFNLLSQNGHFPLDISGKGDERIDYIPGISSIQLPMSIYTIGPTIPYFNLGENSSISSNHNDLNYLEWLDCQPRNSVLYISMGSFLSVSSAQMDEIAIGLRDSEVRFMWVARDETCRLKEVCGDMGLVVPWCDQLKVLSHSSIGGFWTHCGWSSTQEGMFCSVPLLTFPIAVDQNQNSKLIVEDWKIGWRVKQDVRGESLVTREEIARLIQKFMNLESDDVKEMRRRANELQQICQRAIAKKGSSETNINAFIKHLSKCDGR
uniref:UDP-glycosyltransferases domain-containing protein n=1 Tax=Fagus sylvatica TaxID=28930 RepID=A0A2N9FHT3_FAGSY